MAQNSSPKMVNLNGSLNIERAAALRAELASALADSDQVLVSLSLVEELDLACLQVLYAARKSATRSGKQLHLIGSVPARVTKRLAASGFIRGSPERAEDFEAALTDF